MVSVELKGVETVEVSGRTFQRETHRVETIDQGGSAVSDITVDARKIVMGEGESKIICRFVKQVWVE